MRYQQRRGSHFWIQTLAKTTQPSHTKQPNLEHVTNLRVINPLFCSPDSFMQLKSNQINPSSQFAEHLTLNLGTLEFPGAEFLQTLTHFRDGQLILKKFKLAPNLCVARSSISFYCCRHLASSPSHSEMWMGIDT